jgi:hypothetical protein
LIRYNLDIHYVVLITCKKCGELNHLTPKALWNIADLVQSVRM